MPFVTKIVESGEPVSTTRTTAMAEIKELKKGGVVGVIGEVKPKEELTSETYTPAQQKKLAQYRALLVSCVTPPKCGIVKATPEDDLKYFMRKVNAQSLSDLKRFFTKEVLEYKDKPNEVPPELKNIVEKNWRDISP